MDFSRFQELNNLANASSYVPNLLKPIDFYGMNSLCSNSSNPSITYILFMSIYESGDTYLSLFAKADKKWNSLFLLNEYAVLSKIEPFVTDAIYNQYATMCALGMIKYDFIVYHLSNDEILVVREMKKYIPFIEFLHQVNDKQPSMTNSGCSTKVIRKNISHFDKNYGEYMGAFFGSNFNQYLVNEWLDFLEIRLNIASIVEVSSTIEDGSVKYTIKTNTDSATTSYSVMRDVEIEYLNMRKEEAKKELKNEKILDVIKNYETLVAKYLATK